MFTFVTWTFSGCFNEERFKMIWNIAWFLCGNWSYFLVALPQEASYTLHSVRLFVCMFLPVSFTERADIDPQSAIWKNRMAEKNLADIWIIQIIA